MAQHRSLIVFATSEHAGDAWTMVAPLALRSASAVGRSELVEPGEKHINNRQLVKCCETVGVDLTSVYNDDSRKGNCLSASP